MKIAYQTLIGQAPAVVFPWISKPEKARRWQPDVLDWQILEQTPAMVGTTFRETIEEDGQQLEMSGEITDYVADELIAFHLESRIHTVDVRYALQPDEAGSRLAIEAEIRWKFPMNLISLFIGRKMQSELRRQFEAEAAALQTLCGGEGLSADSYSPAIPRPGRTLY